MILIHNLVVFIFSFKVHSALGAIDGHVTGKVLQNPVEIFRRAL